MEPEITHRNVLVHTHIFKNAGSSFDDALARNFGDSFVEHREDHLIHKNKDFLNAYMSENQNLQAFSSHSVYDKPKSFDNVIYYTAYFVRHPIDRIKSVYSFEHKQPAEDSLGATMAKKFDFKGYVNWRMRPDVPPTIRNMQTIFIAGMGKGHGRMEARYEAALKTLEENPLIALVDRYDESMVVFEEYIRESFPNIDLSYVRRNVTDKAQNLSVEEKAQKLLSELGGDLAQKVLENNQYDMELYKKANELLDEKIASIEKFEEKLEEFQYRCSVLKENVQTMDSKLIINPEQKLKSKNKSNINMNNYVNIAHKDFSLVSKEYKQSLYNLLGEQKYLDDEKPYIVSKNIKKDLLLLNTFLLYKVEIDLTMIIEEFLKFYETKYLIAVYLNLKIFKHNINSPGSKEDNKKNIQYIKIINDNLYKRIPIIESYIEQEGVVDKFIENNFAYTKSEKELKIAILLDEISPIKQNTLTRMFVDLIKNMLQHFPHVKFVILNSRLHSIDNGFTMPVVHVTKRISLDDIFDTDTLKQYKHRIDILHLNELLYTEDKVKEKITFNTLLTYPFRQKFIEKFFYKNFPLVEVEILSGFSDVTSCDILIPNGTPSEKLLKEHLSKISLVIQPRFEFRIESKRKDNSPIETKYSLIASVVKNLDIRGDFQAYKNDFFTEVVNFLLTHQDFLWVFVGFSQSCFLNIEGSDRLILEGRLVVKEYENNLPLFFKNISFYIHPPTNGGGRSPAIAIENDTLALTFNFGDCTKYIPASCKFTSFEEILNKIVFLTDNKFVYQKLLNQEKKYIDGSTNYESSLCYMSSILRAEAKFLERKKESFNATK